MTVNTEARERWTNPEAFVDVCDAMERIIDCYGVGSTPEQFAEHVREFMLEGRAALSRARGETP